MVVIGPSLSSSETIAVAYPIRTIVKSINGETILEATDDTFRLDVNYV